MSQARMSNAAPPPEPHKTVVSMTGGPLAGVMPMPARSWPAMWWWAPVMWSFKRPMITPPKPPSASAPGKPQLTAGSSAPSSRHAALPAANSKASVRAKSMAATPGGWVRRPCDANCPALQLGVYVLRFQRRHCRSPAVLQNALNQNSSYQNSSELACAPDLPDTWRQLRLARLAGMPPAQREPLLASASARLMQQSR